MDTAKSSRITAGCLALTNSRDPAAQADNGKIVLVKRAAPRGTFVFEGYQFHGSADDERSWLVLCIGPLFECDGESHAAVYFEHELVSLGKPAPEVAREIEGAV